MKKLEINENSKIITGIYPFSSDVKRSDTNIFTTKGGTFVDCTFGGGGYSKEILKFPKTKVIGIDRDNEVISIAEKVEKKFTNRFQFYQKKFSSIEKIIKKNVDTIIFDLVFLQFN